MNTSQIATGVHFAALPSLERFASNANSNANSNLATKTTSTALPVANRSSIAGGKNDPASPAVAGEEFEAVFVSLMLKQMRSSMTEDGLFGGDSSDTYGGIFDLYMGKHIAGSQPLGIGEMIKSYTESGGKS